MLKGLPNNIRLCVFHIKFHLKSLSDLRLRCNFLKKKHSYYTQQKIDMKLKESKTIRNFMILKTIGAITFF